MVRLVVSKKERKLRRQQRREAARLDTLADLEGTCFWRVWLPLPVSPGGDH